jgi:glycosyltransferase involved in cell wall biosynthesis
MVLMPKTIFFDSAGQEFTSHKYYAQFPPNGYQYVIKKDTFGRNAHLLLMTKLYKYGFASIPWHLIKPLVETVTCKPPPDAKLTLAWNHVVFRDEPWMIHVEWPEMLAGNSKSNFTLLRPLIERQLISDHCKKIITWSKIAEKSFYNNYKNVEKFCQKIAVVPLAAPPQEINKKYRQNNKVKFLFVGSFSEGREDYNFHMKGGKEVIHAFLELLKSRDDIELVMRVEMPDQYKKIIAGNEHIKLYAKFVTEDELRSLFLSNDVFLFPGHDTPFAALLEAMSYGLPVIATDVYGNKELIRNNVDGLLIPPSNQVSYFDGTLATRPLTGAKKVSRSILNIDDNVVNDLIKAMSTFIDNTNLIREMGTNAKACIDTGEHSILYRNAKLKFLYDDILAAMN